jgi:hypothetical protein
MENVGSVVLTSNRDILFLHLHVRQKGFYEKNSNFICLHCGPVFMRQLSGVSKAGNHVAGCISGNHCKPGY